MGDELDPPDVEAALLRVEAALEAAHRVRGASGVVEDRQSGLVTRCAWCGRCWVDGQWLVPVQPPANSEERTTHGICEECVEALRQAGMSV